MTTLETSLTRLITKDPTILNENANKDSNTFSTMRDLTAGTVSKSYALDHLLPKHVAHASIGRYSFSRLRLPSISTINQLLSHRCKRYVREWL